MIIKKVIHEYANEDTAYNISTAYLCGIPIYRRISTTKNINIINQFPIDKAIANKTVIKGFNNED